MTTARKRCFTTPTKSEAYEMGRQCLLAHEARTGRCNVSPSMAQREEWGYLFPEFLRGWDDAKRGE